ncbi:MAG: hypothetical protein ACRD3K_09105, partial [Edaphobacter sp.]
RHLSPATFFDIIQELAAQNRGLTLPDDAAAGRRAEEYIKAKARTNHGQLLYAIVDASIRRVGGVPHHQLKNSPKNEARR